MKKLLALCGILLIFTIAMSATRVNSLQTNGVQLLWSSTMGATDIAVSKDGNYLAAVNDTGLYYFASNNPTPRWWYLENSAEENFMSVAISANGKYVIAGNNSQGSIYYFGSSGTRFGLQASNSFDWKSANFAGFPTADVERGTIDISDNGEYVAVGGTGETLYYFVDCTTKSASTQPWDWLRGNIGYVHTLDMSADGRYVAVGGPISLTDTYGFVAFYKDANIQPYPTSHSWEAGALRTIDEIEEVAVSDDGYAVAAVSPILLGTLYYWANAASLSGNPVPTWNSSSPYACVDTSADGDLVVAGKPVFYACGIHFWANARSLTGADLLENWQRHEGENIPDVKISEDGAIIAGAASMYVDDVEEFWAYFYTSNGISLGEYQLDSLCTRVSMSGDGGIVAVGGAVFDSLYVFSLESHPVGGEIIGLDFLQMLAPFLICSALIIAGVAATTLARRRNH
jgi:hypothetical protein